MCSYAFLLTVGQPPWLNQGIAVRLGFATADAESAPHGSAARHHRHAR
jgi:hypothetical protein